MNVLCNILICSDLRRLRAVLRFPACRYTAVCAAKGGLLHYTGHPSAAHFALQRQYTVGILHFTDAHSIPRYLRKKDLEYRIMQYESVMKNQKESKKRKMRTTRNTTPKDNITYLRYF